VRQLALQYPKSSLNNGRLLIYLTARDKARGEAAVEELLSDAKLRQAKALTQDGGETDIKYAELDIGSKASVRRFTGLLRNEHEGIDIVVNNAGIMMDGFG
jgi:carbonyl reductase 1